MNRKIVVRIAALAAAVFGGVLSRQAFAADAFDLDLGIDALKNRISTDVSIDMVKTNNVSVPYKPDGFNAFVMTKNNGISLTTPDGWDTSKANLVVKRFSMWLEENNFGLLLNDDEYGNKIYSKVDSGKEFFCVTNRLNSSIVCNVGTDNYLVENKDIVNSLAQAMKDSGRDISDLLFYDSATLLSDKVENSEKYDGYATLTLNAGSVLSPVGSFTAIFYKIPSGEWKYFTGTQGVLECKIFDTADKQKAFEGMTCGLEGGETSQVKFVPEEKNPGTDTSSMKVMISMGLIGVGVILLVGNKVKKATLKSRIR